MRRLLAILLVMAGCARPNDGGPESVLVSAASSLEEALKEVVEGPSVRMNVGSSGALLQQVLQGAPVDVFVSASAQEVDALERAGKVLERAVLASNELVLLVPKDSRLGSFASLWKADRIAISNPETVPSGRYARQLLEKRGLWEGNRHKLVYGENVRQTLSYVVSGDVDAGIVYSTDARLAKDQARVEDHGRPGIDHDPILVTAALLWEPGRSVFEKLRERATHDVFRRHGFGDAP